MASECAWAEVVQRRRVDGIGVCASGGWSVVLGGWRRGVRGRRLVGGRSRMARRGRGYFIEGVFFKCWQDLDGSCGLAMVGMGMIFGEDSGSQEDQTLCIFCKQRDIFLLAL
jgi:hypothetical protein